LQLQYHKLILLLITVLPDVKCHMQVITTSRLVTQNDKLVSSVG